VIFKGHEISNLSLLKRGFVCVLAIIKNVPVNTPENFVVGQAKEKTGCLFHEIHERLVG